MKTVTVASSSHPDQDDSSDNSSDIGRSSSYFDPPIQIYRQLSALQNRQTGNFEGNMFVIQRLTPQRGLSEKDSLGGSVTGSRNGSVVSQTPK